MLRVNLIPPSPTMHAGWYGPVVDLSRRFYVLDAADRSPSVGSPLLALCVPFVGNHRCRPKKNQACPGGCFYMTLLVSRVRRNQQDRDLVVVSIEGFLEGEILLPASKHRKRDPVTLPRGLFLKGELFPNRNEQTRGWFAPPLL